ncbi:MAG: amidotransferase 1, exosortase A system-associated [Motiliproteus sp.]|nr:amidotransferase 1, exosortase A system-associated [Motiliproteus sp.]MCW9052390.1 amidotransferase 1, exosortase A system-associated [Motiliproteus sp.]
MCGIAGIFHQDTSSSVDPSLLKQMNDSQTHRGPDDDGYFFDDGIGLAHRRLSIIDLAGGHQPLFNEDNSVCVVFNGEIYNYPALTEELTALGHTFGTHSDTEAIVHAWEEWGVDCVKRFRGMFAFAIWDSNKESLFIARDRLGIKPLFYSQLPDSSIAFGSELKVLKQHPDLVKEIDHRSIEDYFTFGYIPEPKTIYSEVSKLEPGHYLLFERGKAPAKSTCYWELDLNKPAIDQDGVDERMIEALKEAVDIRLVAEVPLGAFLSGGVDSSAVVAMMSQLQQEPVNTCSIGFDVKEFNETEYAEMMAKKYQTSHRTGQVNQDDFELIDKLADLYDEPYADSSAMPTYRVCELARQHVTVALSGDGGDELFAGYRRYRWHLNEDKVRNFLPLWFRKPVFGLLGKLYPKLDWAPRIFRAKTTFQSMAFDSVEGYHNTMSIMRSDARNALFSDKLKKKLKGYKSIEVFRHHEQKAHTDDPLKLVQYLDIKTYLVGDILTKVDRASMAHSLEVRVPLLDHKFVEWGINVDSKLNIDGMEGKFSFKKALEPYLPHDVLYRKKMGFAVPLVKWFRGPLQEKLRKSLLSGPMAESGLFNTDYLETLINQHTSGKRDNSAALWTLMMFSAFLEKNMS